MLGRRESRVERFEGTRWVICRARRFSHLSVHLLSVGRSHRQRSQRNNHLRLKSLPHLHHDLIFHPRRVQICHLHHVLSLSPLLHHQRHPFLPRRRSVLLHLRHWPLPPHLNRLLLLHLHHRFMRLQHLLLDRPLLHQGLPMRRRHLHQQRRRKRKRNRLMRYPQLRHRCHHPRHQYHHPRPHSPLLHDLHLQCPRLSHLANQAFPCRSAIRTILLLPYLP